MLKATVLLGESFEKANMPWFVIPWEYVLREGKGIGDSIRVQKRQVGANIARPSGGTYEAPALVAAMEQFKRVASGHRVLFVLSDGETIQKHESQILADELEDIGVRVIAIGIGIPAPDHHRIQVEIGSADELVDVMPKLVNEIVRKGGR